MFRPNYKITDKLLHYITEITLANEFIKNARLIPKWEVSLRRDALIHSAHSSTHIEGNTLTLEEVSKLELGREISATRKDKQEVLNYLNVLSNINKYCDKNNYSIKQLLIIHKDIVNKTLNNKKDEGLFRNRQVIIGYKDSAGKIAVTFQPPKTNDVPKLASNFIEWLNHPETSHINPILVAGISHYEVVRIHPFTDGNGRTARVLATIILVTSGFDTRRFFALDDYYDSDRIAYYDALKSVDPQTLNITKWLEYFCEGVSLSVNKVKEKVLLLSGKKKSTATFQQVALNRRQMQIVETISKNGQITNKEMQKMFDISPQAVHKEIKKLIEMKVVILSGKGRTAHYKLA